MKRMAGETAGGQPGESGGELAGGEEAEPGGEAGGAEGGEPGGAAAGEGAVAEQEQLVGTVTLTVADSPVVATHTNQITLSFHSEGGDVMGTIEWVVDQDQSVLSEECIATGRLGLTLAGAYDPNTGQLQGTMNGLGEHIAVVSGCTGYGWESLEHSGTWEGQFDPASGQATGQIFLDDGTLLMTFEASRAP